MPAKKKATPRKKAAPKKTSPSTQTPALKSAVARGLEQSGDLGDWFDLFRDELDSDWFTDLMGVITKQYSTHKEVAPHPANIFRAFKECPYWNLKVVILGQDPYPQPYIADGIAFSTLQINRPKSLINIVLEARKWLGKNKQRFDTIHYWNDLSQWARNGVLLLNTALTVRWNEVNSHQEHWKPFTKMVLQKISRDPVNKNVVFVLMGSVAKSFKANIVGEHIILHSPHPAARNDGFRDCDIFNQIDAELDESHKVNWGLFQQNCIHAHLMAGNEVLGSIPGCFWMLGETGKDIKSLIGQKIHSIAGIEEMAQSYLKKKLTPDWMKGSEMHKFLHQVLTRAMELPDNLLINTIKLK